MEPRTEYVVVYRVRRSDVIDDDPSPYWRGLTITREGHMTDINGVVVKNIQDDEEAKKLFAEWLKRLKSKLSLNHEVLVSEVRLTKKVTLEISEVNLATAVFSS